MAARKKPAKKKSVTKPPSARVVSGEVLEKDTATIFVVSEVATPEGKTENIAVAVQTNSPQEPQKEEESKQEESL